MKKILVRSTLVVIVLLICVVGGVHYSFTNELTTMYQTRPITISEKVHLADIELGKRLYSVRSACIDCHGENLAGVKVMDDPAMGTIYGANITPYTLASWSDEEIATAIRYGVHRSGRSLRFMPVFDYVGLSIDDIAAIIAYLRSVKPVAQQSYTNSFGPVAKVLSIMGKMPVMFPAKHVDLTADFGVKPDEGPTAEFGAYLAQACIGCHGNDFTGGPIVGGDPAWPEAANIRLGVNQNWTEDTFKEMLRTGISPITQKKLRPPMPIGLLAQMNDLEVKALWEFFKTLK